MRLLLPLVLVPSVAAQVPDTTVRDTVPLAPVTITATRHATSLLAVPLAVTQIRKRDLFGTAGYGLDDALTLVPGVVAQFFRGFVTVNNLFDRAYIGSAFLNPDVVAGEAVAFEPGLPRHVVVGVTLTTR